MTPVPTVFNPRDAEKAVRGTHWVDGSGQNFRNPWPSFQDRVSVDSSRGHLYEDAHVVVILVFGIGEHPAWLSCEVLTALSSSSRSVKAPIP